jgi:3-methyladenine DNA glycosylase AlkD
LKREKMIVEEIRQELKRHIDKEYRDAIQRFTKDEVAQYGIRTPTVRKISAKYYLRIKNKSKEEIFGLCEALLESRNSEERTIAFDWAFRLRKSYKPSDFHLFESWLKKYVIGWGSCDDLCTHAFGAFIYQFPEFVLEVKKWTESDNRWLRRASAVIMIYSIRRDKYLETIFKIADLLLLDGDDMVQKGYGWMLKEASNLYPHKIFRYVMERKAKMPRTSLRYAIEKLSSDLKKKAMAREL